LVLAAQEAEGGTPQKQWRRTLAHVLASVFLLFYAFTDLYLWAVVPPNALTWLIPVNAGAKVVSAVIFLRLAATGRGRAEIGWCLWIGVDLVSRLIGLVWQSAVADGVL
jgi:hypothetical protein